MSDLGSVTGSVRFIPNSTFRFERQFIRSVPWGVGDYRPHIRYVPWCEGDYRSMVWFYPREGLTTPTSGTWSRIRFMPDNRWDSGVLTSSSNVMLFAGENSQHRWHTYFWLGRDGDDEWLKVDMGSAQTVRTFILKLHWFTPSATIKIQGNATDSWSSPSVDVTVDVHRPLIVLQNFWDGTQSYRWWRVVMNADYDEMDFRGDSDNVPYCQIRYKVGRIYVGNWWEPSVNFAHSQVLEMHEEVKKFRSADGQIVTYRIPQYIKLRYDFKFLTEADIALFESMFAVTGKGVPLFICENMQYWWEKIYYVTFVNDLKITYEGGLKGYSLSLTVETMR